MPSCFIKICMSLIAEMSKGNVRKRNLGKLETDIPLIQNMPYDCTGPPTAGLAFTKVLTNLWMPNYIS
jgi:hypothetical protein